MSIIYIIIDKLKIILLIIYKFGIYGYNINGKVERKEIYLFILVVVMKKEFKFVRYLIFIMIFIISNIHVSAIEITDITEDTYNGEYNIESLLRNYNVVTLGTKKPNVNATKYKDGEPYGVLSDCIHIVGPMLIEGNLENSNPYGQLYHSQYVNGISSYIKGIIKTNGNATNKDDTFPVFYVGSKNKVEQPFENTYNYHINDYQWYSNSETKKTDDYIDFEKLADSIKEEQKRLKLGTTLTPSDDGKIYISAGGNYTIESLSGVDAIVFDGLIKDDAQTTMITITDSGDDTKKIKFPLLLYKDGDTEKQFVTHDTETDEDFYGGNIVWNVTDAEYLTFNKSGFVGHVIAPQADAQLEEMNWAGCFIVNSFYGNGNTEGHIFRYKGVELPKEPEVPLPVVTKVTISKLDDDLNLLPGAELQILDKDKNVIVTWTTTTEPKELLGILKAGEVYILHETKAPEGYELAPDKELIIQETNEIQGFQMINKKKIVKLVIEKRDEQGNFVLGAKMQLLDANGKIVDEWITTNKVHNVTVDLTIGKEYTIHEKLAPKGYKIAEDVSFEFKQTNDIQKYVVIDVKDPTKTIVSILKVDNNNRPLGGAELEILDKNGNRIAHWVSTTEAYIIKELLMPNEVYTLHEIKAPEGYKLAEDIEFTVEDKEDIQEIKLINKNGTIVSPDTGDTAVMKYIIIGVICVIGIALLTVLLKKRKLK